MVSKSISFFREENKYKMGCIESSSESSSPKLNSIDSLKTLASRLKYVSECQIAKLTAQLSKLQQLLIAQFSKPTKNRSKSLQHSMVVNNMVYYARILIYLNIGNHSKIIQEHKNYFDDESKLTLIKASLDYLLYCSSFIEHQDVKRFAAIFQKAFPKHPFPSDNDISQAYVRQFKVSRTVEFQKEKDYIFEFCNRYNIASEGINEVGHNYRRNALQYE